MGGMDLGSQIGSGINRARMQNNPMPPGQQGPSNPFSMIPEFEFDPEKGLNVTLSPEHLQQLITAGIGLVKGGQPQGGPGQMMGGMPPILPQQQQQQPGMQPMGGMPDPNMYRRA